MRKFIPIISLLVFMSSCVTVSTVKLDSDNIFHLDEVVVVDTTSNSTKLKDYNNGSVANFENEGIGNWWGSSKLQLTKKDGNLVVNAISVGREYDRFGYNFVPTVDFSEMNILKVRVKAKGDRLPTLRIDLKDRNGYVTNNQDSKARLILCEEYINYYFRYEGRFKQSWPFKADVSPDQIAQLEIFINPGGENFTGQLSIDEITPVTEEQMWAEINAFTPPCGVEVNTGFDEHIKYCWANSDMYSLSHKDEALLVDSRNAGEGWQSFGMGFSMTSVGTKPVIELKAKVVGDQAAQLRVDLVDFSGNVTNGDAVEHTITNDGVYRTYTFDYQDKMFQGWPVATKVDSRFVNELMLFLNPGGPGFTGQLFIDEVKILDGKTKKEWALPLNHKPNPKEKYVLYDPSASYNTWWGEDVSIESNSAGLVIKPSTEKIQVGTGVDEIDVYQHSILDVHINPSKAATVKLQLMDNRGVKSSVMKAVGTVDEFSNHLVFDLNELVKSNLELNPRMVTSIILHVEQTNIEDVIIKDIQVRK